MITPRPIFGQPETGRLTYWRHRGYQPRPPRPRREPPKPRHLHALCAPCAGGLTDVGILSGTVNEAPARDRGTTPCCTCLRPLPAPKRGERIRYLEWGANVAAFICRVDNPDEEPVEMAADGPQPPVGA